MCKVQLRLKPTLTIAQPGCVYLFARLGANEAGDGAEVVVVGAVQHPEEWLFGPTPLDLRLRLLLAIPSLSHLRRRLTARVPFCDTQSTAVTSIPLPFPVPITAALQHARDVPKSKYVIQESTNDVMDTDTQSCSLLFGKKRPCLCVSHYVSPNRFILWMPTR